MNASSFASIGKLGSRASAPSNLRRRTAVQKVWRRVCSSWSWVLLALAAVSNVYLLMMLFAAFPGPACSSRAPCGHHVSTIDRPPHLR